MAENCYSCGKKFGLLRKKYYCQLCQKEFCRHCVSQTTLSWGSLGKPRFEIVFKNKGIGYKTCGSGWPKSYTLCKACKANIDVKIEEFKAEIKNKLDSMFVTAESSVPGYKVVKSFGFVEYRPNRLGVSLVYNSLEKSKAMSFLKNEALKHGANALINFNRQETHIESFNPPPPPKFKHFDFPTPLDYVPGYREEEYQQQHPQPTYTKNYIFKAEAVVIRKTKEQDVGRDKVNDE